MRGAEIYSREIGYLIKNSCWPTDTKRLLFSYLHRQEVGLGQSHGLSEVIALRQVAAHAGFRPPIAMPFQPLRP